MKADQSFDESQFEHTIVRLEVDGEWFVYEPGASRGGLGPPVARVVHVISGCNPGYRETDVVNERRHMHMERRLRELGVESMAAIGMSPDGSWVEPSWGVTGLTRRAVCALGREFGQVAVFEIEGERLRILRCADSEQISDRSVRISPG